MILVFDNYDSFVYNLAQYLGGLGREPYVVRNDKITLEDIAGLSPSHIVISPGPCTPLEAGISNAVVRQFGGKIPILGVCLGHQCIGLVYGGKIKQASVPTHGKSSQIRHDGKRVYQGLPNPIQGGRYHSLVVELTEASPLEVTAATGDGVIMGVRWPSE
jgi:anthranilate synthase/aminodeoxychorismate synthase-like glutamine amidotransferase